MLRPPWFNRLLAGLWQCGRQFEDFLLILILIAMIGLAGALIVLRNVFASGVIWGDELLRIMVLWVGMLGAVAASRDDNHINIDALSRFLPRWLQHWVKLAIDLFTLTVCGVLTWHAWRFVRVEMEFGSRVLGDWPAWLAQAILPLGFGLISYRYLIIFFRRLQLRPGAGRES